MEHLSFEIRRQNWANTRANSTARTVSVNDVAACVYYLFNSYIKSSTHAAHQKSMKILSVEVTYQSAPVLLFLIKFTKYFVTEAVLHHLPGSYQYEKVYILLPHGSE